MNNATSVEMMEWLHVNRTEGCTAAAMDNAVVRGYIDTLLFLYALRTEGCTIKAAVNANWKGDMAIFEWLAQTYPNIIKLDDLREQFDSENVFEMSPLFDGIEILTCQRLS